MAGPAARWHQGDMYIELIVDSGMNTSVQVMLLFPAFVRLNVPPTSGHYLECRCHTIQDLILATDTWVPGLWRLKHHQH